MKKDTLFFNAVIHTGVTENESYSAMTVRDGCITGLYSDVPPGRFARRVDLGGQHIYPCLIDAHVHLLLTVAVMAMGMSVCEITPEGVVPDSMAGIEARLRTYAAGKGPKEIIACSNFIQTAVAEHRMPTRQELDDWCGGRPTVIYNIDGHSTSLSTKMLELVGIRSETGILQGEENERAQGRITDAVGARMTPGMLARGIANFQNACAAYGISVVGALEGNGDSPKDLTTRLIAFLARYLDVGVRLYLQYTDLDRVKPYLPWMSRPRVGGCGDWEMDGAIGSHSAAFYAPFADTGENAPCYFSQEEVSALVSRADALGYQIASHAIGDAAIDRLYTALSQLDSNTLHRIEHCEFPTPDTARKLCGGRFAIMMQPGYAWIDKRYLHTYERYLPPETREQMIFRKFYDAGVTLCGSSDSPVQDLDPWLQMLGMVQFYRPEESVTVYQAFRCYTANAARALGEEARRGTLEIGKAADFFCADRELFCLSPEQLAAFRPTGVWYGGKVYRKKTGSVAELAAMLMKKPKKI